MKVIEPSQAKISFEVYDEPGKNIFGDFRDIKQLRFPSQIFRLRLCYLKKFLTDIFLVTEWDIETN